MILIIPKENCSVLEFVFKFNDFIYDPMHSNDGNELQSMLEKAKINRVRPSGL